MSFDLCWQCVVTHQKFVRTPHFWNCYIEWIMKTVNINCQSSYSCNCQYSYKSNDTWTKKSTECSKRKKKHFKRSFWAAKRFHPDFSYQQLKSGFSRQQLGSFMWSDILHDFFVKSRYTNHVFNFYVTRFLSKSMLQ